MKTIYLSLIILLVANFNLKAQNFQGKATYQSKIIVDQASKERLDTLKIPDDRRAFMEKMMKRMNEKTYVLDFNKTATLYKEEVALAQPNENGFRFRGFSEGVLYKNTKEKVYSKQKELFGKVFLIKDELKPQEWKLEKESKMIGDYLCFKATTMKALEEKGTNKFRRFGRRPGSGKKEKEKEDVEEKKEEKLVQVVAWYTPEIPINHGPEDYFGLPGLILEVNAGNQIILCNKIVMNPKDKEVIEAPKKGKEVTQKEYNEISEKKMKEMREQFRNNRKKGDNGRGFRRPRG